MLSSESLWMWTKQWWIISHHHFYSWYKLTIPRYSQSWVVYGIVSPIGIPFQPPWSARGTSRPKTPCCRARCSANFSVPSCFDSSSAICFPGCIQMGSSTGLSLRKTNDSTWLYIAWKLTSFIWTDLKKKTKRKHATSVKITNFKVVPEHKSWDHDRFRSTKVGFWPPPTTTTTTTRRRSFTQNIQNKTEILTKNRSVSNVSSISSEH